nr:restriction endonuclease subunit S [Vibrio intestinalis]
MIDLDELTSLKESLIKQKQVKKDLIVEKIDGEGLPDSWVTVNLGGLASKVTDGEHKTPKRAESGRFLLSARNVRDGRIDLSKVDYVGDEEFEKLRKRCDPNKGDILISCSGSVGRIALCDCDDEYVMVRSAALVKTDLTEQNNTYLMYVLQSPRLQDIIVEKSKATAQSNLFLAPIKELPIPLAPVLEQSEVVRKVEALLAKANKVEKQYLDAKARLDRLTQSILAKAFRGELVPQDPNDEPADKLLECIVAEKELSKPKKITRKRATKAKTSEKE